MPSLKPVPREADRNQIEVGIAVLRDRPIGSERRLRQTVAEIYKAMVEIAPHPKHGGLLTRQKQMLEIIIETIDETGQSPTLEELGRQLGMHKTNVTRMLGHMEKRGYIRRQRYKHRSIEVLRRFDTAA